MGKSVLESTTNPEWSCVAELVICFYNALEGKKKAFVYLLSVKKNVQKGPIDYEILELSLSCWFLWYIYMSCIILHNK